MEYTTGQVLSLRNPENNCTEDFKITEVARKYLYLVSAYYSSDGCWSCEKQDPSATLKRI